MLTCHTKQSMSTPREKITVQAIVNAPIEKVWEYWTNPDHLMKWNAASEDWHTPKATNDLRVGGEFHATMAAKDGSAEFDFWGTYTEMVPMNRIAYTMGDGRTVEVTFTPKDGGVEVVEIFEAEQENSLEMQQGGWQAILNTFKHYVESS